PEASWGSPSGPGGTPGTARSVAPLTTLSQVGANRGTGVIVRRHRPCRKLSSRSGMEHFLHRQRQMLGGGTGRERLTLAWPGPNVIVPPARPRAGLSETA